MRPLNPYAPEWKPTALRAQAVVEVTVEVDEPLFDAFDLSGLPAEVITSVVSFLTDPRDLASCICACKLLEGHVRDAELVLDIRSWKFSSSPGGGSYTKGIFGSTPKALLGLCKYMPGTVALLLPNMSLQDSDVDYLVARLPRLQVLDVSGARKITNGGVTSLARATSGLAVTCRREPTGGSACPGGESLPGAAVAEDATAVQLPSSSPLPLRFANLQRCFQLHGGSLDEMLAVPGLRGLALSHLDLGRWPASAASGAGAGSDASTPVPLTTNNAELQVLVLNNCLRLHGAAIDALAAICGGTAGLSSTALDGGRSTCTDHRTGSNLRILMLGGSTLALSALRSSARPPPDLPPRTSDLLSSAYKPALTSTATTAHAHLAAARHLVAAVLSLPRLLVLELTLFPQPLVQCLRRVLADGEVLGGRPPVEVWDLASADGTDVEVARNTLRRVLRVARLAAHGQGEEVETEQQGSCWTPAFGSGGSGGGGSLVPAVGVSSRAGEVLDQLAVSTVLRCVVNCSSVTRSTPLHLAAERGSAGVVSKLLAAGAVVDVRDTAGSTALFLASEAGHTGVVERLLAAGADPRLGNTAGETPLYIAALRGHLGCVKELLLYCKARGIDWQDPEMYGDSWTPLHAAAVANRADVAAYLLQAAGASGAVELVLAPNKYGQSVLHVAARKGSSQLLRLLLSAGGIAVVVSRDGSGDTPVDVAKKNRHVAALAEFRRLTGGHTTTRGSQGTATAMA